MMINGNFQAAHHHHPVKPVLRRTDPQNTLPSGTAQRTQIDNCRDVDFDAFDTEAEDKQKCRRYFQSDGNFCKWHDWGISGTCASEKGENANYKKL